MMEGHQKVGRIGGAGSMPALQGFSIATTSEYYLMRFFRNNKDPFLRRLHYDTKRTKTVLYLKEVALGRRAISTIADPPTTCLRQ
jgi:hypothetical protein